MSPKHPLASRTTKFGLLVCLLSVAELTQEYLPTLLADMTPKANAWITLGIGIAIIVLRFVTKTPITFKADDHVG